MNCSFPLITLALVFVLSVSCERHQISTKLKNMMSDEIVMPDSILQVKGEVVDTCSLSSSLKLVIYVDSSECSTCRIEKLNAYSTLYDIFNSSGVIELVVLVAPKQDELNLIKHMLGNYVKFPTYVDVENQFLSKNTIIPIDWRYHSFLTDCDGKVVFVGDPVSNTRTNELFWKALGTMNYPNQEY